MTRHIILGLHGFSAHSKREMHDAGVCLLEDGEIIAAVDEERLSRRKRDGSFPRLSYEKVMEITGINPGDIESVAFVDRRSPWQTIQGIRYSLETYLHTGTKPWPYLSFLIKNTLEFKRVPPHGLKPVKVAFLEHHQCHAASAYYHSPWEEATVISLDGMGDFSIGGCIANGKGGNLEIKKRTNGYFSPGHFYMIVTDYLGFIPGRHEGKVMGLAAHGDPKPAYNAMKNVIRYRLGKLDFSAGPVAEEFFKVICSPPGTRTRDWYAQDKWSNRKQEMTDEKTGSPGLTYFKKIWADYSPEDIAAAAQKRFEDVVLDFIRDAVSLIGCPNVAVAGGVFANVRLNQKILELPEVDNLFIQPNMSDGGLAAGAALLLYHKQRVQRRVLPYHHKPLKNVFLGPIYHENEIEELLLAENLKWSRPKNLASQISEVLIEGKIVGIFQGRMEYGPRALGNRSILATATDPTKSDTMNARLNRTEIMPFAPAILEEHAAEWFPEWRHQHIASQFMTMTYNVEPSLAHQAPAIVHIDGTARPQIVKKNDTPLLHGILTLYHNQTGVPLIINTSFNIHEDPIVCSPKDALKVHLLGAIDILVMERIWVEKS